MENKSGISIVELFTSEGCSSCPPADMLVSEIAMENKNVYVLSYHVDYWDYLGWKDPFSQAKFSDRQRQYARLFKLQSVYTPQIVVNGRSEFVGSDEQRLRASIKNDELEGIDFKIIRKGETSLILTYNVPSTEDILLHIALVQPQAESIVKRGENRGKTLRHKNVVRYLKSTQPGDNGNTTEIPLDVTLRSVALEIIVFTQEKNGKITAASRSVVPTIAQ